jgi:hypothetical protein
VEAALTRTPIATVGIAALLIALAVAHPAHAQRAQAELACAGTITVHVYDCTVRLSRGGRPLEGARIVVGADMPSMPLAHVVRPVTATPGAIAGEYTFRLALEMSGRWAVKLRVEAPVRDQLIVHYDFSETAASPARR